MMSGNSTERGARRSRGASKPGRDSCHTVGAVEFSCNFSLILASQISPTLRHGCFDSASSTRPALSCKASLRAVQQHRRLRPAQLPAMYAAFSALRCVAPWPSALVLRSSRVCLRVPLTRSRARASRRAMSMRSAASGRESSPLSPAEQEHLRRAPVPYPKADILAMTPKEREALRLRSRSLPLVSSNEPLDIVFEDETFLVVSKPSWLKMHPIHRFQGGTLLNRVIGYLGYNPHMCHRLDMHTSGVVMFLKDKRMCADVAEAFRDGKVEKHYLCIVDKGSKSLQHSFAVDAPIERHPTISVQRQIGRTTDKSKESLTLFRVESTAEGSEMALLRASPQTGRTHQIRLHASHIGLPIVGDDVYGRERMCYRSIEHVRESAQDPSLALYRDDNILRAGLKLHAWQVALMHPVRKELVRFCAPPPQRFTDLAESESLIVPSGTP